MSSGRTLVLADAHLRGLEDPNQAAVVQFLSGLSSQTDRLVLLGDFFDFLAGHNRAAEEAYRPVLSVLGQWREFDYLEGNHDFDLSPDIPGLGGARIHRGPANLVLGDLSCHLLHGDRSSPTDWGTRLLRTWLQSRSVRLMRDRVLPEGPLFRFGLWFAGLSRKSRWPGRADEMDWLRRRALVARRNSAAAVVIFAHSHRGLLERDGDGAIANPGPANPGGSYLEVDSRDLRLRRFPDGAVQDTLRLSRGKAPARRPQPKPDR